MWIEKSSIKILTEVHRELPVSEGEEGRRESKCMSCLKSLNIN